MKRKMMTGKEETWCIRGREYIRASGVMIPVMAEKGRERETYIPYYYSLTM
jgi:hypothetical protein